MRMTVEVKGLLYNDVVTTLIVVKRLETIMRNCFGYAPEQYNVKRTGDSTIAVALTSGDAVMGCVDIVGMKEIIAAEFEPIAKLTFTRVDM